MTNEEIKAKAIMLIGEILGEPFEYNDKALVTIAALHEVHGVVELAKLLTEEDEK